MHFIILSGSFWQLTDIHYDYMYNDPSLYPFLCRSQEGLRNSSTGRAAAGKYGDYNCDSPWSLVVSAINAMTYYDPQPDFILWTGYFCYLHVNHSVILECRFIISVSLSISITSVRGSILIDRSPIPSVGLCVCVSRKCTVAKWPIGSDCRL